jgi:Ca2+-binding RTX toxin-like protein
VGLAGDDSIALGTGLATVTGDSGNDTVITQAGNTGTIDGGTENDSFFASANPGSMLVFAGAGMDTINFIAATSGQTIVGGSDSSDGADSINTGTGGADLIFGNGGNDTIRSESGADTFIGGFGNDSLYENAVPNGDQLIFGNEGNDSVFASPGNDTVFGGLGNDSVFQGGGGGSPVWFGNEGADTMDGGFGTDAATLVGGQDSADGADSLVSGTGADFVFGNGGNDTITAGAGANTVVGGFGTDSIVTLVAADLIFANENNDTVSAGDGANTVFGGLGNDTILGGAGRETIQGNENNDTIRGDAAAGISIDTISGGSGNDVFAYADAGGDGDNATGGGPVEFITDVDFSVDRFDTTPDMTFAANLGAGTGGTLADSATNAINAATALNGGVDTVAAQFTFGGRTYLAINLANAGFLDTEDLLVDITGATGTIGASNFI